MGNVSFLVSFCYTFLGKCKLFVKFVFGKCELFDNLFILSASVSFLVSVFCIFFCKYELSCKFFYNLLVRICTILQV